MLPFLSTRHRQPEWMDAPDADPAELRRSLLFIRRVNRLFGYTRSTLGHLKRFSRRWKPGERIRILDVATGSADVPRAILRWADRHRARFDVHVVGIDLHATTASEARHESPHPRLHVARADALSLPFAEGSFDYALTSMFLHHLDEGDAVRVLSEMSRVARRGVIAADLLRHRRAYAWISLFTAFAGPMVRHDARVSVAQAFTKPEVLRLRERAGLGFAGYHRQFGHRFVLAGEKGESEVRSQKSEVTL
jgi:ubiquinone/menaquinone biosynthesis C-methylase UbiE